MKFYYISTKHIIQTRRYFCEQKLFHSISSFDIQPFLIRANPVESAALILYLSQIFTKPRFNEYLHY